MIRRFSRGSFLSSLHTHIDIRQPAAVEEVERGREQGNKGNIQCKMEKSCNKIYMNYLPSTGKKHVCSTTPAMLPAIPCTNIDAEGGRDSYSSSSSSSSTATDWWEGREGNGMERLKVYNLICTCAHFMYIELVRM